MTEEATDDRTVELEAYEIHENFGQGFAFAESTVNKSDRLIRNVSLLGKVSKNGHVYTDGAMREAAELFRGVGVFVDHPTRSEMRERPERSVRDLAGRVLRATANGNRVKGDVEVLEGEDGDRLLALADRMPSVAGFSLRGDGEKRRENGETFVEHVTAIGGADVVASPATTEGLFESIDGGDEEMDYDELTEADLRRERPDLIESIETSVEEAETVEGLQAENRDLKEQVDALETEKAEREHRALVEEKLAEAELPDRAVTDAFRELLVESDSEEKIDALIEDRKDLLSSVKSSGGPRSVRRDPDEELSEGETEEVTGEVLEEAYTGMFGGGPLVAPPA